VVRVDDERPHGALDNLEAQLTRLARQHYRSLNGEMLAALTAWVERYTAPPGVVETDGRSPGADEPAALSGTRR
jgi:hypothetical protein